MKVVSLTIHEIWPMLEVLQTKNKRHIGHIAHLRDLGPYENIYPISKMYFISICPIQPSGAMILIHIAWHISPHAPCQSSR
jgi:hypothetical protein